MPLEVNLHHVEDQNLHLQGELPVEELEVERWDEMIHVHQPLHYDLQVQKMDHAVLLQGTLVLELECECVRCLAPFKHQVRLAGWACHVPLQGEEKAPVVSDCVDLTPYLREDIVLAFPRHPLCKPDCGGLAATRKTPADAGSAEKATPNPSTWAALDKLKL